MYMLETMEVRDLMGESSSKVACVASENLNIFPVGIKVECLVYSVC